MVRIRELGLREGFKMESSAARSAALDEKFGLKKIETTYCMRRGQVFMVS
jgi:hypothetical protein